MISDVVALVLGIVATLTGGVLVWLSYTYHRQQGLRFWEREKRLPDATRYENLKFLNEQEESKLRELRDQLFDARNTIEEADRKREWLDGVRDEIARLEADRLEVQRVQAELESVQRQLAEHNELKVELDAQIEERKQALADLVLKVNGLKSEVNELTATASKLASVRQDLEAAEKRRSELDLEIQRMRSDAEINKSRALDELDRIQRDHTALSQQLVELKDGIEQRLKTRNEVDNQIQARQRELDELNADLSKLKREAAELAELNREAAKVREELRELNASKLATEADQSRISRQIDDLKQTRSQLEAGKKDLEQQVTEQKKQLAELKRELEKWEQELREKKMQAKELGVQIPILEGLAKHLLESNKNLGGGNVTVATDLWLPVFSNSEKKSRWNSETDALAALKSYLKHHGLKFHDRTLNAFHTSLKTTQSSPLVVLAGVSGTGKSELPRRYSEAMGMNFLNIAVQPRWDSPQDLFGFYDYLEQRFRPD